MRMKHVLVTGSAGLIGSEAACLFAERGCRVTGIDNDMRARFFGQRRSGSPMPEPGEYGKQLTYWKRPSKRAGIRTFARAR